MADRKATKSVGEFWVCCKLAMNGWAPALTRDGLERTDILATRNEEPYDAQAINVQVKTSRDERWPLNPERIGADRNGGEWFVLVAWHEDTQTLDSYVIPRDHVSAGAWLAHMAWLTDPTVPKGQRNAGPDRARIGLDVFGAYKDRWDLLLKPTDQAPILLPHWCHEVALGKDDVRAKLPDWHPWAGDNLPEW